MKKYIIIVIVIILVFGSAIPLFFVPNLSLNSLRGGNPFTKEKQDLQTVSISTVNNDRLFDQKTYEKVIIEGYVVDSYKCPPCENPGVCSPCPKNSIVLGTQNRKADEGDDTHFKHWIRLYLLNPDKYKLGKKYTLTIYSKPNVYNPNNIEYWVEE